MNNTHKINPEATYIAAKNLYDFGITGEDAGADSILMNLRQGIEILKQNWHGKDAGIRIEEVVRVHNAMVKLRNDLANLVTESSKVAAVYREIEIANGTKSDPLNQINCDIRTNLSDYSDSSDMIDINPAAEGGKRAIDAANGSIGRFKEIVNLHYNEIRDNWMAGPGRDVATSSFETFLANAERYKQTLSEVSANITKALQNYTF